MHSVSSASRIEHELARSPGVAQATVNLTTEEATVRYRPEAAELERAVARAGCQLRSVQVEGEDAIDRVMRGGAIQRNVAPGPTQPGRNMNGRAMGHTGASSP